jgi:hypothetical protein
MAWGFENIESFETTYRLLYNNRYRFNAEYEAAKARGDAFVTFDINVKVDKNINFDAEIERFLTTMKPVMLATTLAKKGTGAGNMFDMAVAAMDELDSELFTNLAMRIAADGEHLAFYKIHSEELAALMGAHDEHLRRHKNDIIARACDAFAFGQTCK